MLPIPIKPAITGQVSRFERETVDSSGFSDETSALAVGRNYGADHMTATEAPLLPMHRAGQSISGP